MPIIQTIPTQLGNNGRHYAEGYLTPKSLDTQQCASFPPERVIPVFFLPGIMGSNLRMNAERQAQLRQKNNIACRCEKVILVTHSMGGLVGRALCHPEYGNLQDKILGIVHGVMPAIGAAAAYRRMRAGFEGGGITNKVLGHTGPRVTAVLANAPGGLQLLPSDAYGKHWLRVETRDGRVLKRLPENGDPYAEIYSRSDVWWGLLREEWINPAGLGTSGLQQTYRNLLLSKEFHQTINATYHPVSYAHYGCDPQRQAFLNVIWQVPDHFPADKIDTLTIAADDTQGKIHLTDRADQPAMKHKPLYTADEHQRLAETTFHAALRPPADPGDQTVPMHSADDQLRSGRFKAIFRQTGYEHQDSYKDRDAIASTLYSIVRIAQEMKWSGPCP